MAGLRAVGDGAADGGGVEIVKMQPDHWPAVREIYVDGIRTGLATFETEPPGWEMWDTAHLPHSRLAAVQDGRVLGWAALSAISDRCAYGGVAEVSVYVAARARGQGLGTMLLRRLVEESEENGVWTLQAGIFPGNRASVAIHEACGFRTVGVRERLGRLHDEWRDVVLMERRSQAVGI